MVCFITISSYISLYVYFSLLRLSYFNKTLSYQNFLFPSQFFKYNFELILSRIQIFQKITQIFILQSFLQFLNNFSIMFPSHYSFNQDSIGFLQSMLQNSQKYFTNSEHSSSKLVAQINNQSIESIQNWSIDQNKSKNDEIIIQCQQYLKIIKQKIKIKYQNKQNQSKDQKSEDLLFKTKKILKKQQVYLKKYKLISSKKNISQLWINRLIQFLKQKISDYYIYANKLNSIKQQIVPNLTIKQLTLILKKNPWINHIIQNEQKNFLNSIYISNLMDQSKLILFETYHIFIEAINAPDNLKTWNQQSKQIQKQSLEIYQRFVGKSITEMCELAIQLCQKYRLKSSNKKCSPSNNITYCWTKYFKDITRDNTFVDEYSCYQKYQSLIELLQKAACIQNLRKALSIDWFAGYIKQRKIDQNNMVMQIIMNPKMNLLSKMNMIISIPVIMNALENPNSFVKWKK